MAKHQKTALITGVTGQDGSYLAEFLLRKKYHVVGLVRKTSHEEPNNVAHLKGDLTLVRGDLTDSVIGEPKPHSKTSSP